MFGGRIPNYHKYADKLRPQRIYSESSQKRNIRSGTYFSAIQRFSRNAR